MLKIAVELTSQDNVHLLDGHGEILIWNTERFDPQTNKKIYGITARVRKDSGELPVYVYCDIRVPIAPVVDLESLLDSVISGLQLQSQEKHS